MRPASRSWCDRVRPRSRSAARPEPVEGLRDAGERVAVPAAAAVGARRWRDRSEVRSQRAHAATSVCTIRGDEASFDGACREWLSSESAVSRRASEGPSETDFPACDTGGRGRQADALGLTKRASAPSFVFAGADASKRGRYWST